MLLLALEHRDLAVKGSLTLGGAGHIEGELLDIALGHADEVLLELIGHKAHAQDVGAPVGAQVIQALAALGDLEGDLRGAGSVERLGIALLVGGEALSELLDLLIDQRIVEIQRRDGDGHGLVAGKLVIGLGSHLHLELEDLAALDGLVDDGRRRERRAQVALVHGERHEVVDSHLLGNGVQVLDAELLLGCLDRRLALWNFHAHARAERIMRHIERLGHLGGCSGGGELDEAVLDLLLGNLHGIPF